MNKFSKVVFATLVSGSVFASAAAVAAVNDAASDTAKQAQGMGMSTMGTREGRYASDYASDVNRSSPAMRSMGPASPMSKTAMPKVSDSATSQANSRF